MIKRGRIHIFTLSSMDALAHETRIAAAELFSPTLNEMEISNRDGFANQTTHPKAQLLIATCCMQSCTPQKTHRYAHSHAHASTFGKLWCMFQVHL